MFSGHRGPANSQYQGPKAAGRVAHKLSEKTSKAAREATLGTTVYNGIMILELAYCHKNVLKSVAVKMSCSDVDKCWLES